MKTETPTGKTIEFVEFYTRKQDRELEHVLFDNAKSTKDGSLDQSSVVLNIERQSDKMVLLGVKSYAGQAMSQEVLDSMPKPDFEFAERKCQEIYQGIQKKKD